MNGWDKKTLSEAEIAKIKADRERGMTYELLSVKYGASKGSIYRAIKGGR